MFPQRLATSVAGRRGLNQHAPYIFDDSTSPRESPHRATPSARFKLSHIVKYIRQFWVFGLILMMVAIHAMIILTVRRELTHVKLEDSSVVDLGGYRFQHISDKATVYQLHLHAVLRPSESLRGSKMLYQRSAAVSELLGQQLRQAELPWYADPTFADLKIHLMQKMNKSLNIDFIDELIVTDWLEVPVGVMSDTMNTTDSKTATHTTQASARRFIVLE